MPVLSQVLTGGRKSQLAEMVTNSGKVTSGTFTAIGEKTGEIDLHKSKVLLFKIFSPAATVPVGRSGKDIG